MTNDKKTHAEQRLNVANGNKVSTSTCTACNMCNKCIQCIWTPNIHTSTGHTHTYIVTGYSALLGKLYTFSLAEKSWKTTKHFHSQTCYTSHCSLSKFPTWATGNWVWQKAMKNVANRNACWHSHTKPSQSCAFGNRQENRWVRLVR